jgi:peptidoglycan hydrolase-like protein with peptidoglycan-binding domain
MALARGSEGSEVKELQQFLVDQGYDLGAFGPNKDGVDGDFGRLTEAALRQYQEDNSLEVTGSIDGSVSEYISAVTTPPEEPAVEEPTAEVDAGGGVTVTEGTPVEEGQAEVGVGAGAEDPELQLTILTGEEMNWYFDETSGNWYVGYGLPNSNREIIFESTPGQMDALFGTDFRPDSFERVTLTNILNREETTFSGNIAEMEGEGTVESEIARVTSLALDGGQLPTWAAADGAALDIVFIAQAENKSNEWVLQQLSKEDSFQQRFPNLTEFQNLGNLTLADAVSGFLEMEAGVRAALQAVGEDPDAVTSEVVGSLLAAGHSLTTVQTAARSFKRMTDNAEALQAFNDILAAEGLDPLTSVQDMFDFVNGQSEADLYNLWEASTVQELATSVGLGGVFGADDAINLALRTPGTTVAGAVEEGLRSAAEMALRLRNEIDLNEFGLELNDVVDVSLGLSPTSGRTQSEVMENINRAILQARASVQSRRASPFTGFRPSGTPQAQSLGNLRTSG